jgi:tetratricopeptide (TPR) repeat protein
MHLIGIQYYHGRMLNELSHFGSSGNAALLLLICVIGLGILVFGLRLVAVSHERLTALASLSRWLLVGIGLFVIILAAIPLHDLELRSFADTISSASSAVRLGADAAKTSIDELKWLLTIIAGFAVLTAIANAAAAWFTVMSYDKQASIKLEEIRKVQESVKARYPLFEAVEEKRKEAHAILLELLKEASKADDPSASPTDAISWLDDFYRDLKQEKRQLVLSVESFVSIDLHPARVGNEAENLKRFAVFYHSKFRYEKGMKVASSADLDRAENYLLLALRSSPTDFTLLNELGNVYLTMWEHVGKLPGEYPNYLNKARDSFQSGLDLEKNQQRGYYNLAYISACEQKYGEACSQLEKAISGNKPWQRNSTAAALSAYVHYNLGCCRARVIVDDHAPGSPITLMEAQPALDELREASQLGVILVKYVENDYATRGKGDIFDLYQMGDAAVRKKLDEIKPLLTTPRLIPTQNLREALKEAVRIVRKAL